MHGQTTRRSWAPDGLPPLTGSRWSAFLAIWLTTLALALAASAMLLPDIYRSATQPAPTNAMAGLTIFTDGGAPRLGPPVGSEAERSGLRWGDRLLAIDGALPAATSAGIARQLMGPIGSELTVTTRSLDGVVRRHRLTRDPRHYREALAAVGLRPWLSSVAKDVLDLVGLALLPMGCAIVLLLRRARDRLAPWASLMMLLFVLGNLPGYALAAVFPDPILTGYVFNTLGYGSFIAVLAAFPEGRFVPRWSLAVAVLGPLACGITQTLPPAQSNAILALEMVAAVAAISVRYRAMPPGVGRQQIRWALLGFAASVLALMVLVVLQSLTATVQSYGSYAWLRIGGAFTVLALSGLFMLGVTFGLLRYRLYDADTAISRSVVYGALTLSLLAIFAGSEKLIEAMGEHYFGEELGALAGGLGAAVAAVMIVPLHHRVSHWAEHRFRSGLAHLRHGLPLLVGDLRETASPRALAATMLARVEQGVRARHGAVVVGGELLDARDVELAEVQAWLADAALPDEATDPLYCDRADPVFPMRVPLQADGAGLVGWLLLGPRPDGSFYGREDRAALREIADPVARALAIATARERRETGRDREIAGLRDLVRLLQHRLDSAPALQGATV